MSISEDLLERFEKEVKSMQEAGFLRIGWLACGDERTCPACAAMDRKALPFGQMRAVVKNHRCENEMDGCRCTFVIDEKEFEESAPKPLTEEETQALQILRKLLDPNYPLSSNDAKEFIIEASKSLPSLATTLKESGIPINEDTVPKILELLREHLGPYRQFLSPE